MTAALTGNEIVYVQGVSSNSMGAAIEFPTTTSAIAALANSEISDIVNTAITTVGNGTLTAAALTGGVITRSGPVAVFTDTTATAAQLYSQLGSLTGISFVTRIKNTTAFAQTLAAGTGVTLPTAIIIPANSVGMYLFTINTANTATVVQIAIVPLTTNTLEIVTALTTVGAGTITAAGIAGGVTARSGPTSAYTDTTATADLIIAAVPNANIGQSWEYTYYNTTAFTGTIAGGTGVTPSRYTLVPANSWVRYLVTYTAASTITMVGIAIGSNLQTSPQINTAITTVGAGTLTAAGLVGGMITRSGSTAAYTDTTGIATDIIAALPNAAIGQSFRVQIKNTVPFAQTITGGTGVTVSGQSIIAPNSVGTYLITYTAASTITMVGISIVPMTTSALEIVTTLSTVGAGTITAAGIAGGITNRTGSQSGTPFTDTTDTATNIIAAQPNANIGQSWEYTYQNTTNAVATLTGGTGVTVSGITAVNAGYTSRYLVTYTAATTITMVGFSSGQSLASTQQSATFAGSTSGTTILKASATAGSTTQTLPAVSGVVASTTGSNLYVADITRCSASVTANATVTYANVTGLSQTVVVGTYRFRCVLPSTVASGTGGIKYAFNYTTAVLSSIEATGIGFTASAVAVQHTTTTTTQTDIFTQAAVVIMTELEGTMVVSTGGTVDLQMAQNTSNASNSITLIGSSMEFVRIA